MASGREGGEVNVRPCFERARGLGEPSSRKLVPCRRRPPFSSSSRIGHRRRRTGPHSGSRRRRRRPQCLPSVVEVPVARRRSVSAGRRSPSSSMIPMGKSGGLGSPHRWSPDDPPASPCNALACCADERRAFALTCPRSLKRPVDPIPRTALVGWTMRPRQSTLASVDVSGPNNSRPGAAADVALALVEGRAKHHHPPPRPELHPGRRLAVMAADRPGRRLGPAAWSCWTKPGPCSGT